MLNQRLNAARRIADALVPTETDIEAVIASTSRLIGAIAEGRCETGVAITIGQESLAALSGALTGLVQARADIAAAHAALAEDRISSGLRAYGMGDVSDCPDASASLKLVAGAQGPAA
jgi:L-serine deaminase